MKYPESELIINADGSIFHLHITPQQLADRVILVGDPDRVNKIAEHFDSIECDVQSREFHTITGQYKGKRITALSTGIGCDNIDIVVNELDALANINFQLREDNPTFRQLTLVRIGTCGGLQPETPIGTFVASVKSIGFDGLLNYYADRNRVCDLDLEAAFVRHMQWNPQKGAPYVSTADPELLNRIAGPLSTPSPSATPSPTATSAPAPSPAAPPSPSATVSCGSPHDGQSMVRGITIACGGFYGPQGRQVRMKIQDPDQNRKVESFRYTLPNATPNPPHDTDVPAPLSPSTGPVLSSSSAELKVCNFEMESSALAGLASILGHKAMTCCMVIANRYAQQMNTGYKNQIDDLIRLVLDRI